MTDVYANDPEKQAKLDALREHADALGINYHHRAGIPKLQQLIAEHRAHPVEGVAETAQSDQQFAEAKFKLPPKGRIMTQAEFAETFKVDPAREANRLIRCRVQCMNPVKREWAGEIISVSNAAGTWKKYIPFNNEPYHIPKIMFDLMKDRECVTFITKRERRSNGAMEETRVPKLIKEFAIEELPPLTEKEIKELAQQQAMRDGNVEAVG